MQVGDVMKAQPLVTVDVNDRLGDAAQRMLDRSIRHLPVLDKGRLTGVLSERDLLAFRGYGGLEAPVRMVMRSPAKTARPADGVDAVAERMAQEKLGCMPIVDDGGQLVGIVTTTDLLTARLPKRPVTSGVDGLVRDAMTRDPAIARSDDHLLDAVGRMTSLGVRHLPVCDGENRVLGMLSDRDVRRVIGDFAASFGEEGLQVRVQSLRVQDAASMGALVVGEGDTLVHAARLLVDRRIGAVPVLDGDGRLCGILSYLDVLRRVCAAPEPVEGRRAKDEQPSIH
jgi:CBS domain-containing protein